MKESRPIILKIGGSVITDKNKALQVRMGAINRLAQEIEEANIRNLIIVHGGGSFGHPLAQRYSLVEGFKDQTQKSGFSEIHHVMTVLNGLFMDALIWRNIPTLSIAPSSCIITRKGRVEFFQEAPLRTLLKMDFLPVLYGDAVLDSELGFTILSGDQLVSILARKFNAERIIIGVDVDGLYDNDPNLEEKAKMFNRLTLKELKGLQNELGQSTACDVTGGMYGKMTELIPALEQGISASVVNATKPTYIYKALVGEKVQGTLIEKEQSCQRK